MRLKALKQVLRPPKAVGVDPSDFSEEAGHKRTFAPGAVWEELNQKIIDKFLGNETAKEPDRPVSTPEEVEELRIKHIERLKKLEEKRLEQIRRGEE